MSGKGSVQRPPSVPRAEYDRRWTETFAATTTELPDRFRLADGEGEWTFLIRDPDEPDGSRDAYERSRIGNLVLTHHTASECAGQYCSIHNPSDHPMRDWPLLWRWDRGLMERTCHHGVGHPDPDHIEHIRRTRGDEAAVEHCLHGCCGCCGQ